MMNDTVTQCNPPPPLSPSRSLTAATIFKNFGSRSRRRRRSSSSSSSRRDRYLMLLWLLHRGRMYPTLISQKPVYYRREVGACLSCSCYRRRKSHRVSFAALCVVGSNNRFPMVAHRRTDLSKLAVQYRTRPRC
jgi:hypothetical protein